MLIRRTRDDLFVIVSSAKRSVILQTYSHFSRRGATVMF